MTDEYILKRQHYTVRRWDNTGMKFDIHYMRYFVTGSRLQASLSDKYSIFLEVPCKARLHHLLTGLFYNWNWDDEGEKVISEEEAYILKHVFNNQQEYSLWKKTIEKLKEEEVEKAKEWFFNQIKMMTMKKMVSGGG